MDNSDPDTQNESGSNDDGVKMKLQIRTARVQKFITVDENIAIQDVS